MNKNTTCARKLRKKFQFLFTRKTSKVAGSNFVQQFLAYEIDFSVVNNFRNSKF